MPRVANPPRTGAVSAAECKGWEDAAINWVNQQNPAVVLVASGPDLSNALSPAELTAGYAATIKALQGLTPLCVALVGRKSDFESGDK